MKATVKPGWKKRIPTPSLGFRFTLEEEIRMRRAVRLAENFMESYGSGHHPYMLDKSHYLNSGNTKI